MSDSLFLFKLEKLLQENGVEEPKEKYLLEKTAKISLNFSPIPNITPNTSWYNRLPLQSLAHLARGGLSGPVQEDKAIVYNVLIRLIKVETKYNSNVDLRDINGLSSYVAEGANTAYSNFEELARTERFRSVKIVSFDDLAGAISKLLPDTNMPVDLCIASWYGSRLYWRGNPDKDELLVNIIVYARRRGIELLHGANITNYSINYQVLDELGSKFQVLNMPNEAWSNPEFMSLLLDTEIAYSRMPLRINSQKTSEWIFLPNDNPKSYALGVGLRLAGAYDVISDLRNIGCLAE